MHNTKPIFRSISNLQFTLQIDVVGRVFVNGQWDRSSIPGWVITKTQKMVLDVALLITQHCKLRINGKMEQSRARSIVFPYTSVLLLMKRDLQVALDYGHQFYLLILSSVPRCADSMDSFDSLLANALGKSFRRHQVFAKSWWI